MLSLLWHFLLVVFPVALASLDVVSMALVYFVIVTVVFLFFSVRLLSVLRGHSVFSSPPQRPMTSDFEGVYIPDFIHYIYFPILILEIEPVFSLLNVEC